MSVPHGKSGSAPGTARRAAALAAALLLLAGAAPPSAADDDRPSGEARFDLDVRHPRLSPPPDHRVNLRVGAATGTPSGRPSLCLEVAPILWVALEACGTGSGLLHQDPGGELAHFRAKGRLWTWHRGGQHLTVTPGLGLAELEVGRDRPGFRLDPDAAAGETAAAGPEASAGLMWLVDLPYRFEVVADATVGMAWVPGAPRLASPQPRTQPFAGLSLGLGW